MLKKGIIVLLLCCMGLTVAHAQMEVVTLGTPKAATAKTLIISEVMAANSTTIEDAFGNTSDWIELYNTTDAPISLKGYALSDKKDKLEKYRFADDAVINAGAYLLVFASGLKKDVADEYHTSFKLSASGEAVYLSLDGVVVDSVYFENQDKDISYALDDVGEFEKTTTPTPGYANVITLP